ncbi:MAG: glycosyltransferase family 4 protein [Akkermansiaceae bacterium]
MNITITSSRFSPELGGTIVVALRLAKALTKLGHEVTILTNTPVGDNTDSCFPYQVKRCLPLKENLKRIRHADGVILIEMSLKWWALTRMARKPHLVTHHAYPSVHGRKPSLELRVQRLLTSLSPSTGCSKMIANAWGKKVEVLPNPYDENVFMPSDVSKDVDFIFAGRLIEEKGVLVFLKALGLLRKETTQFQFAILGGGRQESEIRDQITKLGLDENLIFFGETSSEGVAEWFQRSKTLVVPSVWREPFGLIALEALACGARLICSDQPGLREASGELADFFTTGDTNELSLILEKHLKSKNTDSPDDVEAHLAKYRSEQVAELLVRKFNS